MNNGHTRESKHHIAVLEDEDVDTFIAFCEYAYTGDYNVPRPPTPQEYTTSVVEHASCAGTCWRGTYRSTSVSFPGISRTESSVSDNIGTARKSSEVTEAASTQEVEEAGLGNAGTKATANMQEVNSSKVELVGPDKEDIRLNQARSPACPTPETAEQPGQLLVGAPEELTPKSAQGQREGRTTEKNGQHERHWTENSAAILTPSPSPPSDPADVIQNNTVVTAAVSSATPELGVPVSEIAERQATEESLSKPEPDPNYDSNDWEASSTFSTDGNLQYQRSETEDEAEAQKLAEEYQEEEYQEHAKPIIDMSFARQLDSSPRTPGLSLWDEFVALQYHDDQQASIPTFNSTSASDFPYLKFHAKVYVFATRYLIPALAQLCLRKLHRDLLQLSLADLGPVDPLQDAQNLSGLAAQQAPLVLDLLRYSYTKTTRLEPISPTSATQLRVNELRRLVVHYAACNVKELTRYHSPGDSGTATPVMRSVDGKMNRVEDGTPKSLRALLDSTPELASDLVYRLILSSAD